MYVCPHCHEEIPDRVKRVREDCPFCHEDWPPEPAVSEEALGSEEGGLMGGSGEPSHPIHHVHDPEAKKSKLGLIIGIVAVVLIAAGVGSYFLFFKSEEKGAAAAGSIVVEIGEGDNKEVVEVKKLYGEEFEAMVNWHNEVRRAILEYLAHRCDPYRKKGFSFGSQLVTREKLVSTTKKVKNLELEIQQKDGKPVPIEGFNWFRCPGILSFVHKEHEMGIKFSFSVQERALGSDVRRSTIEITGGKFVDGKGEYSVYWDMGRSGLSFPGLGKTDAKNHEWLMQLRRNNVDRKSDDLFHLAGVPFKRTATGRLRHKSFLVGKWEAKLSTKTFRDLLRNWAAGCRTMRQKVRQVNKKYPDEDGKFKVPVLKQKAVDITAKLCNAMKKLSDSVEPWKEEDINSARKEMIESLNMARDLLRKPLVTLGKKIKNDMMPHHWCGDYKKDGSECKK